MLVIKEYYSFNQRRYGDPWVAIVKPDGQMDFTVRVGGYTGARGAGEAGALYIAEPVEGRVYAYGQKDYRGNNGGYEYIKILDGEVIPVAKTELIAALS